MVKGCYRDVLKIPRFVIFVIDWDVSPLFERFVVFICIYLTFTQSQCPHCSFVQANHLLNKIPQIISKAIFITSLKRRGCLTSSIYPAGEAPASPNTVCQIEPCGSDDTGARYGILVQSTGLHSLRQTQRLRTCLRFTSPQS